VLPCSTDGALYQDQRWGSPFTYSFTVPAGNYQVTLKFAETYWTAAGKRVFNASINGTQVLTNFDIFAATGGMNRAIDKVFNNVVASGNTLTVTLGPASVDNAMLDSIQVIPQPATVTPTSTGTSTFTRTSTNSPTVTNTSTNSFTSTLSFTPTNTLTWTNTGTSTSTATSTNSWTPSFTATSTFTSTATGTPSFTRTFTSTGTSTFTRTATSTFTNSFTATATPTRTSTPTATPTPAGQTTWRVVAGGPAHTDCQGNVWSADSNFSGGTAAGISTNAITGALPCSTDGALYQAQRYGSPFTYSFAVPAGSYQVMLKFAETYWTAAGQRVFNVSINGSTVLTNFDIFATAGIGNKAVDKVFNNIAPSGGNITIQLGPASVDNAMVDSIQVIPQSAAQPTATFTKTATPMPASATHLVGYLPDYGGSFATFATTINWNKMTHLNLAFVNPPTCNGGCSGGSNMNFSLGQSDANIAALVNAAHAHGVKVLASIGGAGGDAQIVQFYNAGLSSQLVASLNNYVAQHNLDGVDLDIEQPNNVGANFSTFAADCINTFHPQGKLVTAAVAQYITQGNMSNSTLFSFDFINVMVYDNLSLCQQAVNYYTSVGEPKSKIVLGVPFFGSGGGQEPTWASIVAAYPNAGSTNSVSGGSFLGGANITYVGFTEMAQETQLGVQNGGVMIWDLSQDAPAPNSMLSIIQNNIPLGGAAKPLAQTAGDRPTPTMTPTASVTSTPTLPMVAVLPNISRGGESILFKVQSDQGSPVQLSLFSVMGEQVLQTSFAGDSGGYLWKLGNQSGNPVASGLYIYVLRFKQGGQDAVYRGKISVLH